MSLVTVLENFLDRLKIEYGTGIEVWVMAGTPYLASLNMLLGMFNHAAEQPLICTLTKAFPEVSDVKYYTYLNIRGKRERP